MAKVGVYVRKNRNYIYIIIMAVLLIIFAAIYVVYDNKKSVENEQLSQRIEEYNERINQQKLESSNKELKNNAILKGTPGIACWGDGYTYGTYGNGTSYPYELEQLIKDNEYPYDVVNLGVYGEDSRTVLGRAGAIPFVIKDDFTITGTSELIEIAITSEDGNEVNPCIQEYNPGFNPCLVGGISCTIYGATTSDDLTKASGYYLSRQDNNTKSVDIEAGTVVVTSGSTEYKDYINILLTGDCGGYSTDTELVEQNVRFVESLEGADKYLIIGRLIGGSDENEAYDEAMEEAFGDHYLNAREILSNKKVDGVSYSESDITEMERGGIPECLGKNGYLNSDGYKALAELVYDRLMELELLEKADSYTE